MSSPPEVEGRTRNQWDLYGVTLTDSDEEKGVRDPQSTYQVLDPDRKSEDEEDGGSVSDIFGAEPAGGLTAAAAQTLSPVAPSNVVTIQQRSPLEKACIYLGGFISVAGAISLLAISILYDYGLAINVLITTPMGFLTLFPLAMALPKKVGDAVKDVLIDYGSPFFYFAMTQLLVNVPNPTWVIRLGYGIINFACGAIVAAQVHNVVKWRLGDDLVAQRDADLPLLQREQIQQPQIQTDHRIAVPYASRARSRVIMELFKAAVGIGAIIAGYVTSASLAAIALKLGYILLGHALGGLEHEGLRALTKKYERKYAETHPRPLIVSILRVAGKVELVAAFLLSGLIGFNTPYTDVAAGFFVGVLRQIYWIRFTRTPVSQQDDLFIRNTNHARSKCKFITNIALGTLAWIPFYIWQTVIGDNVDRAALAAFTGATYLAYVIGMLLDRYDILNGTNLLLNTLFFYFRYAITPPIVFIAISQVMEIGDIALSQYALLQIILAMFAWADLGSAFGFHGAYIQTKRDRQYPATLNSLIMLYTYFIAQQIQGPAQT